jgi:cell division protein FtsI (penicillin-binding protein 3)
MMETVVTQGGAKRAGVLGYRVAGKTGTARIASGGGYAKGRYASFFAGLVPASNPRFAAVVVINDSQEGGYYGGLVAAPVFHDVMDGTLRLMDVPPDDIEAWLAAQAKHAGKPTGAAPAPIVDDAVDTTDPSAFDAPHATLPATGTTR